MTRRLEAWQVGTMIDDEDDHDYEHEQNVNYWIIGLILVAGIVLGLALATFFRHF